MTFKKKLLSSLLLGAMLANGLPAALAAENEISQAGGTGQSSVTLTVEAPSRPGGGSHHSGGGGSSSNRNASFTISIKDSEGAETDPSGDVSVKRNDDLTVKIAAKDGYEIVDVIVDGKSQGAINSYTFKRVQAKHTLSVTAKPTKLLTDDHIAYIKGYPDGGVHPWAPITRAETAAIFYRLMNAESREKYGGAEPQFIDTDATWAKKEIAALASASILKGYQDDTFRPNAPITRAEFAAIASRFDKLEEGSQQFSDVPTSHWAYELIASAAKKGWVNGYEDGAFRPDNNITRSEAVKITNAVLERSCDEEYLNAHLSDVVRFNDISDMNWAYLDIMEAANAHEYEMEKETEKWTGLGLNESESDQENKDANKTDKAKAVKMASVSIPVARSLGKTENVIVSEDNQHGVRLRFVSGHIL